MSPKARLYMNLGIVVCTIIALVYFLTKEKLKVSGKLNEHKRKKIHNKFLRYSNSLLLRKKFNRIVSSVTSLSCYDENKTKEQCVQLFENGLRVSTIMVLFAAIAVRDTLVIMLMCCVAYVYYEVSIEQKIDRIYEDILDELSVFVQSIREFYMEYDNIPKAVLFAEKGKLLHQPATMIYEMLSDADGDNILEDFCRLSPVRLIKTIATTCYIFNEFGDAYTDADGSMFARCMIVLRQEIDAEIRRLKATKVAFKSLLQLTLIGMFAAPPIKLFLLTKIPGTSVLLKGMYGYTVEAILAVSTIVIYTIVANLNRPSIANKVDRVYIIDLLCRQRRVRRWVSNLFPKKFKTRSKLNRLLHDSLSSKDLEYIYTAKVLYSLLAFVLSFLFIMSSVYIAKDSLYHNYKELAFGQGKVMKEEQYRQIVKMDNEYLAGELLDEESTVKFVKGRVRGLNDLDYLNQSQRLIKKYTLYYSLGFKWYFVIISYIVSVICWFIPEMSLMLRKQLVAYEASEDVLQLQTMMVVLGSTTMDVLKALYWLEKQATIHKPQLRFAYHEFTSDPELALERLQNSVQNKDLKRLVSKLKRAVYSLSLADAFSDAILDKQQSLALRTTYLNEQLESKTQWAKMLVKIPMGIAILGLFMAPILILGWTSLGSSLGKLMGGM